MAIMLHLFLLSVFPTLAYMTVRDIEREKEMGIPGKSRERVREKGKKQMHNKGKNLWAL